MSQGESGFNDPNLELKAAAKAKFPPTAAGASDGVDAVVGEAEALGFAKEDEAIAPLEAEEIEKGRGLDVGFCVRSGTVDVF